MKIMFSAGEASGDTHAASVAQALKELYPNVEMIGMGGAKMEAAGVRLVYNIDQLGFIGIVEILKALPFFFRLRSQLKEIMLEEKPDVFVCVDYPGFNMRMAKVAHDLGIPVVYYICPTIWAWHRSRGKDIAKYTTKVASIFPFEAKAYEEFHANVEFVGHPLLDIVKPQKSVEETIKKYNSHPEALRILLMPGSRRQEIEGLLHTMLMAMKTFEMSCSIQEGQIVEYYLPRAHTIPLAMLEKKLKEFTLPVQITEEDNYDVMNICHIAVAASGTATLETALMNLPTILVYRVAPLTYMLGKMLLHIPYVGLPNIVADRMVIPELLQNQVTPSQIASEVCKLYSNKDYYEKMKSELKEMKALLGEPGAVRRVAQIIGRLVHGEDE